MDDLRHRLERLSRRGTPRGSRPVFDTARTAALGAAVHTARLVPAVAVAASVLLVAGAAGAIVVTGGDGGGGPVARQIAAPPTSTTAPVPAATPTTNPPLPEVTVPTKLIAASRLQPFNTCGTLLGYARTKAVQVVGPYGLPVGGNGVAAVGRAVEPQPAPAAQSGAQAGPAVQAAQSAEDYSGTNIQEAGVDEPDRAKTDGRRLFTLAQGRLWAVALEGSPRVLGSLPLDTAQQLLLTGNRVIALGNGSSAPAPETLSDTPTAHVTVVDVTNPGAMRVTGKLDVNGGYLSARLVGGVARIVFQSSPHGLDFTSPQDGTPEAQAQAIEHNRQVVRSSTVNNYRPTYRVFDGGGRIRSQGRLVACADAYRPPVFSGFGTLSVVTLDADHPEQSGSTSVMADGDIVYASPTRLYVSTNQWGPVQGQEAQPSPTTLVHEFDISDPAGARYLVSGQVRGVALNQFALSEDKGYLRVATTDLVPSSESFVTVLSDNGKILAQVGQVGGLGHGERIYAVRFIGDAGYVVTFRRIDPLYVVDLSKPTRPRVVGELELQGYSAYLHPIGPGLLLGVGVEVSAQGVPEPTGVQVSVFDVSKPTAPRLLQRRPLGKGSSSALYDHHAFLYWAPTRLAMLPLQLYDQQFNGAVGLTVGPGAIDELGRFQHPPGGSNGPAIERAVVVGDRLFTVSQSGVLASALRSLAQQAWVPFG